MAQRRREVSDEAIFSAVERVVRRRGPSFTLAEVGREAGLSAPRLVQRFGSRARLLELTLRRWAAVSRGALEALARSQRPLAAWIEWSRAQSRGVTTAQAGESLAWIQLYRADPALSRLQRRLLLETRSAIESILEAARRKGELARIDPPAVAHRLVLLSMGNLIWLAVTGRSETKASLADLIEAEVAPWRRS
jgi:AcrR family transcriptional regulator